jgi:outer membrane protein OmpA-like peptidoglycan-associated protein
MKIGWDRASRTRLVLVLACVLYSGPARADLAAARQRWKDFQAQDSALLAPRRHQESASAMGALEAAVTRSNGAETDRRLAVAEKSLQGLDDALRQVRRAWGDLLQLRAQTSSVGGPASDPRDFKAADNVLFAAAQKLEAGRTDAAQRQALEAKPLYEAARFAALRQSLLKEATDLLARAETMQAREYVPRSYVRAFDAVRQAEGLMRTRGTADADVQQAAAEATRQARHATFLLERVRATCEGTPRDRLEATILNWEEALDRALRPLGLQSGFESGLDQPLQDLGTETARLVGERNRLRTDVVQNSGAADSVAGQLQKLQEQVAQRDAEVADLRKLQVEQETLARIQGLFTRQEGRVLLENRDVILSLPGLRFASGKAEIPEEDRPLLDKLVQTVQSLPGSRLVVEGHTDSQGSPEKNQALSEQRAAAIRDFLAQNAGVDAAKITLLGYGASRPVASNDTEEGRALNRRIEITIARPD